MADSEKSDIMSTTEDMMEAVEANTSFTPMEINEVIDINRNQHIEQTTVIQLGKVMTAQNFTPTEDMVFGDAHIYAITAYVVLFLIGLTTNIASLIVLIRNKRNRMSLLLIHLTVADLSVILLQIPLEVAWAATVEWWAGDVACRILVFTRIFGYYLSSFVMIVISVDRFSAIVYPLSHHGHAKARTTLMLYTAWALAAVCSLPQSFVFSVKSHPMMTSYKQCTTIIGPLQNKTLRLAYGYFCLSMTFFVPLLVMIVCYTSIAVYIFRRSKNSSISHPLTSVGGKQVCMVTSSKGLIGQAKIKTVKLTGVLIIAFTLCWMPFNVLSIWHYVDRTSADLIDFRIQKFSWVFACTNNCFNPLIYGMFQYGSWTCCRNSKTSRRNGINHSRNPTLQYRKPILNRQLTEKTHATSSTCLTHRKNTLKADAGRHEISIATDTNRNPDDFQMIMTPPSPNFSRMELSVTPWSKEDQL